MSVSLNDLRTMLGRTTGPVSLADAYHLDAACPGSGEIQAAHIKPVQRARPLFQQFLPATRASTLSLFSVRLVNGAYTGPALRVTRASDSAALDFYADLNGNLKDASGNSYASWIGASTGTVSIWYDQSGNGRNATPSYASMRGPQLALDPAGSGRYVLYFPNSGATSTNYYGLAIAAQAVASFMCTFYALTNSTTFHTFLGGASGLVSARSYTDTSVPNRFVTGDANDFCNGTTNFGVLNGTYAGTSPYFAFTNQSWNTICVSKNTGSMSAVCIGTLNVTNNALYMDRSFIGYMTDMHTFSAGLGTSSWAAGTQSPDFNVLYKATQAPVWRNGLIGQYMAEDFTGSQWNDRSGSNNHATTVAGTVTKATDANSGAIVLTGGTTSSITLPTAITPSQAYTLFHVAKYNGANKQRIVTSVPSAETDLMIRLGYHNTTLGYNSTGGTAPTWVADSTVGDYVQFAPGASVLSTSASCRMLNFGAQTINIGTKGFSILCRFRFTGTAGSWERLIDFGNGSSSGNILIGRYSPGSISTNLAMEIFNGGSSTGYFIPSTSFAQNTIYNVAFVYDPTIGTNGQVLYYLNGAYVSSYTPTAKPTDRTISISYVGKSHWADAALNGDIFSLKVYNRAITASDVQRFGCADATETGLILRASYLNAVATYAPYPPAPLTANSTALSSQPYGNGTYVCSTSTNWNGGAPWNPYKIPVVDSNYCTNQCYNGTNGAYNPASNAASTAGYAGEWHQIQFPSAVTIARVAIACRQFNQGIGDFAIFGSNDGTNWTNLLTRTGNTAATWPSVTTLVPFDLTSTGSYSYYRLAVGRGLTGNNGYMCIPGIQWYAAGNTTNSYQSTGGTAPTWDATGAESAIKFAPGAVLSNSASCQFLNYGPQRFNIGSNGFTVVFRFMFTGTAGNSERIIEFSSGSPNDNIIVFRNGTASTLAFVVNNGTTGSLSYVPAATYAQNTKYTVAYVYDPTANTATCYIDGVAQTAATPTVRPTDRVVLNSYIGKSTYGASDYSLNANLYWLKVYERPLSASEIKNMTEFPTTWISGHRAGNTGFAHHGSMGTALADRHGTDWVLSSDQNALYRSQTATRSSTAPTANPAFPMAVTVNGVSTEASDWAVGSILAYNRVLTLTEILAVEDYLASRYRLPVPIQEGLVLSMDASDYVLSIDSTTWRDRTANAYNFTVNTSTYVSAGGTYSFPYFNFGGSTAAAYRASNIANSTYATVIAFTTPLTSSNLIRSLIRGLAASDDHHIGMLNGTNSLGYIDSSTGVHVTCDVNVDVTTLPQVFSRFNMWAFHLSSVSPYYTFYFNPNTLPLVPNGTISSDTRASFNTGFGYLGYNGYGGGATQFWGNVACFMYYNRRLSEEELVNTYNRYKGRYGLPNALYEYPPAALTSAADLLTTPNSPGTLITGANHGNGLYKVRCSSQYSSTEACFAAFDYDEATAQNAWTAGSPSAPYQGANNTYIGSASTTLANGTTLSGEWLEIQLPNPITLNSYYLQTRLFDLTRMPKTFYVLGSNTGANGSWVTLDSRVNVTNTATGITGGGLWFTLSPTPTTQYTYYRIVATQLNNIYWFTLNSWRLFAEADLARPTHYESVIRDGLQLWLDMSHPACYQGKGTVMRDLSGYSGRDFTLSGSGYTWNSAGYLALATTTTTVADGPANSVFGITVDHTVETVVLNTAGYQSNLLYLADSANAANRLINIAPHYKASGETIQNTIYDTRWNSAGGTAGVGARILQSVNVDITPALKHMVFRSRTANGTTYVELIENGVLRATTGMGTAAGTWGGITKLFTDYYSNYYRGNFYFLRVYNRALSDAEVTSQYNLCKTKYDLGLTYPPIAMTAATTVVSGQPYGNGSYTVTASSTNPTVMYGWWAFQLNKSVFSGGNYGWESGANYATATGAYTGSSYIVAGYTGDWIKIQLPAAITLSKYVISPRENLLLRAPVDFRLYGSNDDATWTLLDTRTGTAWSTWDWQSFSPSTSGSFKYYAIVVNKVSVNVPNNVLNMSVYLVGNPASTTANPVLLANPYYYYPFNGTLNEWIRGANATLTGTAPTYPAGKVGTCLYLNSNTPSTNPVQYLTASTTNPTTGTIAFWFQFNGAPATGDVNVILYMMPYKIYVASSGGQYVMSHSVNTSGGWLGFNSATPLTLNTWYHYAWTFNSTTNAHNVYINGVLDTTYTSTGTISSSTGLNISYDGLARAFKGQVDEFAVFTRVLTAAEIQSLASV